MKVLPFQIPKPENNALIFQEDIAYEFYNKLHQHDEIQISFIVKGEGTLIVGDTINSYQKGNLLVFGNNLPHVFKNIENFKEKSHMITLFFTKESFGNHFFDLEEFAEIQLFFNKAKHGLKISSNNNLEKIFLSLKKATKLERFIKLLKILKNITVLEYESLSSFLYEKKYTVIEGKRMRDIFDFTMQNYKKNITLDDISEVAVMTKNAFCKYFKKRTNKTYFQFLNELRIEHACKLMISNSEFSLAEIAYNSGFNNISNFNRQFKNIKKTNPSNYKRKNTTT